ncbi:hypothetical protein CkaCkLH20_03878 [Colletotrichum karsti]|uniref:ABC transporter n=1 Tax=Colletotrichum karsti TaxID=1095194 RepID=A0A9P6LMN7_9PEZI|nr:uncharacterized protein CkaCkLH20_03878 [Colletotrichum karsti]KAF9878386.1 hypothetical protein CkaCkLH20_03878 [Colletotrichum karsti]
MDNSSTCADTEFGPVHGCRGDFDFSLFFEQSLLSVAPSCLFLVLAAIRFFVLLPRQQRKARLAVGTGLRRAKLGAVACYGAIQIALLVTWARAYPGPYKTKASLAAAVFRLLDVFALGVLSWLEHSYSPRPSALLNVYLLVSLIFDAVQTRTLWLKAHDEASGIFLIPAEFTASLVIKSGLLVLELIEKQKFLLPEWRHKTAEETAGVFNRSLLIWLRGILTKGRKTLLAPTDLDPLSEGLGTAVLSRSFWAVWNKQSNHLPSLASVILRTLRWSILAPVIPRLAQVAFTLCQPLLLREFLRYLAGDPTFVGSTGYGFIITYGLVYLGIAISGCIYWRLTYKCLVKMRGSLVSAVYSKTTQIDAARCDMTTAVPLISTDMERIIAGFKDVHEIWANTLQVAIAVWLLYRELGIACVAPAVVAAVSSLGSMLMSAYADQAQVSWMEATQERVGVTARAVSGMQSIKLLGLSQGVFDLLRNLRGAELHAARHFRHIEVLTATIAFLPLLLSPVFTFLVFVLQARSAGEQLDTVKAFTSLSLLQLMTQPLVWLFQAVPLLVASFGCLGRIEKYLHAEAKSTTLPVKAVVHPDESGLARPRNAIAIRDGEFGWTSEKPTLTDVNVDIPASRLTMIIGPVGSGKSTLARVIISELPHIRGDVRMFTAAGVNTDIAFCSQEPFIMYGTLVDNITGFSDFDSPWLEAVIHAVDLENDIAALPRGRATHVGSKGTCLSGGQQQRVAVARALYARKQLVVFDDVLSGLDAATKIKVFERALGPDGLLRQRGCTVVLCTHDIALLPRADHVIVLGADGRVAEMGTFDDLRERSAYVRSLMIRTMDVEDGSRSPLLLDDDGRTIPSSLGGDSKNPSRVPASDDTYLPTEPADDFTRRLGDASIYKYLAGHIGLWRVLVFLALTGCWAVFSTIGTVWLNYWSSNNAKSSNDESQDGYYLGIYAIFQVLALVFLALFSGFSLTSLAVKAGTSLHQVLLKAMIWAPQSFFGAVDTGITTNRFSQDIILVDGDMPMSLLETISAGLVALVQMVLIAVAAPYVAIVYPFLLASLHLVQSFYLRTSRQLRFLDLEARSPLQTQLLETIQGLATIRSFGWAEDAIEANHDLVDASQKPVYLLYMVQRWLQLVLELMIAVMAILVAAIAPRMPSTSGGFMGVALIQLMSLSQELKMIVINYTNLETSLTAISRIKAFETTTPSEDRQTDGKDGHITPPPDWPQAGHVVFRSATASYSLPGVESANLALKDVNLDIAAGQKVAICGRSGSGKSTMIAAMTRMTELSSGSIHLDGVDISSMRPSDVRSAINTIPQEPFFFHNTVAANIDPLGVHSDEVLLSALDKVSMRRVIEDAGGLRAAASLDNLSQGQKQLLALARAILKRSNVVLMDEATSSVDQHTADMMKRVIRDEFKGVTVIAVAHQLDTIVDFDVVVVMDAGRIVEVGTRRKSEASRLDETGTEASSSPVTQSTQTAARSNSIGSHASPHGSNSFESQQLTFELSPPTGQRLRGEAPAQRFTGHGSHGDGNAPIGFMLSRGPPAESQQPSAFAYSPASIDSTRDGLTSEPGQWNAGDVQPQLQISYLLGDSPSSTQPGSIRRERAESFISDVELRLRPAEPEHWGFTGRQAYLFRTYIMRIAPSIDACHDARPFTLDVPRLALCKPILLNGIFALASRFDAQGADDGTEKSDLESTYYHNRCIELLIEAFSQPPETWDSILLTAVVIMRLYEEYDNETDSHYHHLRGTRNLLNHDAIARFVTQGGLAEAASWVHLRQALYVILVRRTPIEICLENFERSSTFQMNDDTACSNRIVYLFAKVLKLFFPENGTASSTAAWEELQGEVETWYRNTPLGFRPLFYDRADLTKGRPFPTLWMSTDPATVGLGYYYSAKAIFCFQEHNSSNSLVGFEGTKKRLDSEREITFYLCTIMGLALSNEAVNAYYLPAHMLSLCGHLVRHPLEREHTIKYLAQVRNIVQWKTGALVKTLKEQWAELDSFQSR